MDADLLNLMADKASKRSKLASQRAEGKLAEATRYALMGDHAKAADYRKIGQGYVNDAWYWRGQMNAYKGMAGAVGIQGVIDMELDQTPTCP